MTDPDTILLETEEAMEKALNYLKQELRGIRTGRAHPALVEFVKVDYYGSMTDLKALASVSVPEPTQLLIKPFDAGAIMAIKHGIEQAGLGLNPMPEGKQIRINVPALSQERRLKLATPTPTPESGWWETFPTPFVQATGSAVPQPTRGARPVPGLRHPGRPAREMRG